MVYKLCPNKAIKNNTTPLIHTCRVHPAKVGLLAGKNKSSDLATPILYPNTPITTTDPTSNKPR